MSTYKTVRSAVELLNLIDSELDDVVGLAPPQGNPLVIPAYGRIYDLPLGKVVGFIFQSLGLLDGFKDAASSNSPDADILLYARECEPKLGLGSDQAGTIFLAQIILLKTLESISLFHESIHKLLSKAAEGDDEALLKAVYVDPNVLQSDVVAQRIATASINDDGAFFNNLSKAIKKSRPIRPREHLDEVRLMLAIVEECQGLDSVSDAELTEWATEFGLYPVNSDALQAVRRQRQKHQKVTSHQ
jgi:hypothetical protein